ncbi:MAG: DUF4390 domain-containing protein [Gemmatimonadaceae bacterium]
MTLRSFALLLALALLPASARGQSPALEVTLPVATSLGGEGPAVRSLNVLSERKVRDLLRNGFPARLHFRAELWTSGGPFNSRLRATEWYVVVRYDALRERYEAVRLLGDSVVQLGRFALLNEAVQEIERPYRPRIAGEKGHGRQYYNVTLELEMMSVSDLDEVERWLRGEFRPAVRGERNPGTALGRGMRTLLVRLLGAETRTIETRSKTFKP